MSTITSTSPTTGETIASYETHSHEEVQAKIKLAHETFQTWQHTSYKYRQKLLLQVANELRSQREELAALMTLEMGKRSVEALAEIDKCALVCEYYANNSEKFLEDEVVRTEAKSSYLKFEALGVVLAIMPWNFPFWQVFRAAAPALMAGNTMLLKHASSVPGCALAIENIFVQAGTPTGVFQTLLISGSDTKAVVEHPHVRLVSLTGSEEAGSQVASLAGKSLKRSVLELGGSDPFIVMPSADLSQAVATAVKARLIVSGQSCIAAKRFIVHQRVADRFTSLLKQSFEVLKLGDPADPDTDVGPLSSLSTMEAVHDQVVRSVRAGARLVTGGKPLDRPGFFYTPTILARLGRTMPVAVEETFGPVAAILEVDSLEEAVEVASDSHFGLGSSVWTSDQHEIEYFIDHLQAGSVFVNAMVKSDPRLPFGGTKFSGYGRELGTYGLKEFVSIKTVWIN